MYTSISDCTIEFWWKSIKRSIYQTPQVGMESGGREGGYSVYAPYMVKSVHCLALKIN